MLRPLTLFIGVVILAPIIVSIYPSRNAEDVALDSQIAISFSNSGFPIDAASVTGTSVYLLDSTQQKVAGALVLEGSYLILFTPTLPMPEGTYYQMNLLGDVIAGGIRDTQGTYMTGTYSWSFSTTGEAQEPTPAPDEPIDEPIASQPLTITKVKPVDEAANIEKLTHIEVEFNRVLDPESVVGTHIYIAKKSNL